MGLWAVKGPSLYAQEGGENPIGDLQRRFEADSTQPSSCADLVDVETALERTPVLAGEAVRAAVVLTVRDGWHVNAHWPTYDYLIGTEVTWDAIPNLEVHALRYPAPKTLALDFADDVIDVHEGTAVIFAQVRPAAEMAPGDRRVTAAVRVQACSDKTCLRPSTIRAPLTVPVAEASATPTPTGHSAFEGVSPVETAEPTIDRAATVAFLRTYGALLAGGLLLLGTIFILVIKGRGESRDASV